MIEKLRICQPVSPWKITQVFGVNGQYYQNNGVNIIGHNGLDLEATHGQPIYAAHDGTAFYEYDGKQGEGVVLRTNEEVEFTDGTISFAKTIYWHFCDPILEPQFASPIWKAVGYKPDQTGVSNVGVSVKMGDLIGYADNTGLSTGDHLHFALKPQAQDEANGTYFNLFQNNGYGGAIDPAPYISPIFAPDYKTTLEQTTQAVEASASIVNNVANSDLSPEEKSKVFSSIANFLRAISKFFFG